MKRLPRVAVIITLVTIVLAGLVVAFVPLSQGMIERWSQRDLELRSSLVFQSIRDRVEQAMSGRTADLAPLFERFTSDERILALGLCDADGQMVVATGHMPKVISCGSVGDVGGAPARPVRFAVFNNSGNRVIVGGFPVGNGSPKGRLLIVHELRFVADRVLEARWYLIAGALALILLAGTLAALTVILLQRRLMNSVLATINDLREGQPRSLARPIVPPPPVTTEIRSLLRDFREKIRLEDGSPVEWSPKTLHDLLDNELPDTEVFVVSNREPYIHNHAEGGIVVQRPASGLVSALEPVMRACGGIWIAHGSGTADRDTVDGLDHVQVPPGNPAYRLRRVWMTDDEQEGYYYGLANEGLWPLCHIAYVRPIFRESDWQQYVAINQRFADAVVREATRPDPVVMVQDYHFALVPRMIRQQLPKATILTFWHIPWPNAEAFGICPWKEDIIEGLLGSTVLGFHTRSHCNNFFDTVDRYMESRIDREQASVTLGGHETMVRPYPISIEWPPAAMEGQAPVAACREAIMARYHLPANIRIGIGIERFDYTKGILDRLRAMDDLLTRYPEWLGKLVFIQVVAPTRSKLASYATLQDDAIRLTAEINERHGSETYQPILLVIRHHEPDEVYELFRAADICVVSSLHDGMNLVAKEFVASRDDEDGVLVLSRFAGASSELGEALIINPYDIHGMSDAMHRALSMPEAERRERMHLMRAHVRERNVYRWAGQILLDASRLRKRQKVADFEAGNAL
ncbi:MAG: trehalose-6-phosphate synthase [Rhizobiales bacterium]|nr:trehalose-6-phosphate synthase [Hyphomicrobiales bacterium]